MMKELCLLCMASVAAVTAPAQMQDFPPAMASGTLPVIFIDTEENRPVIDKTTYVPATFAIASERGRDADVMTFPALTIRGRGNVSWTRDKKPYKLKFDESTELLGMPPHKHYALLPQQSQCDLIAGMMERRAAELLGMGWVPRAEPVELVLNGRYDGIYLLSETVKVHPDRLDIFRQPDRNTDPGVMEGGWLLEIDNYEDPAQIVISETADMDLRLTYHCPEELSAEQSDWLREEMMRVNAAIYSEDISGASWAELIDGESAARYFLVRELFHDFDGYNGSFYIHKDLGHECKWQFGPMWDMGFGKHKTDWIMNDHPEAAQVHWIGPMSATRLFVDTAADEWALFEPSLPELYAYGQQLSRYMGDAMRANNLRWPEQSDDAEWQFAYVHGGLMHNAEWIAAHLSKLTARPGDADQQRHGRPEYYTIYGVRVDDEASMGPGIYICKDSGGIRKIVRH